MKNLEERVLDAIRTATEKSVEQYPDGFAPATLHLRSAREGYVAGYMEAWTASTLEELRQDDTAPVETSSRTYDGITGTVYGQGHFPWKDEQ